MNNTWFISDQHFMHKNVLEFEERPFQTIEEMQIKMIEAWNSVVGKHDTVFVVGDFCFAKHLVWKDILGQLKGNVTLIKGNHDKTKVIDRVKEDGFLEEIYTVGHLLKVDKYYLNLSHYPMEIGMRPFLFSIHGHIHNQPSSYINQINVGVDSKFMGKYYRYNNVPFGTPVPLEHLMKEIESINEFMIGAKNYAQSSSH